MDFENAYGKLGLPLYIIKERSYNVIFINEVARRLFGDIKGQTCYEALNGATAPCDNCCCVNGCSGGEVYFTEARYFARVEKFVDTYANQITLSDGSLAWVCIALDVTERERARQASAAQYTERIRMQHLVDLQHGFIQSAKSIMTATTLEERMIFVNEAMAEKLGYSQEQILRMSVRDFHPPEVARNYTENVIPQALQNGVWRGETLMRKSNGMLFPIRQVIFPIANADGEYIALASIIDDITDELEQERRLESARRTLRAIIDTAPGAIFWKDKNSVYLGANMRFASDVGVPDPSYVIGKTDHDLFPEFIADKYVTEDKRVFETGEGLISLEEEFVDGRGGVTWVTTSKVLMRDGNDEPYALLGIYVDIAKQKLTEIKLNDAIRAAEEASKAKSNFLSRMSHEIRTPMNAILGMTKIGQDAGSIERMRYCFDKIEVASKHLLGLINDILDMSKIEANRLELVEGAFDLVEVLKNVQNVINVRVEEKRQILSIEVDKSVPSKIVSDEMRITQVITNLLSNAVKFTPDNGIITLKATYTNICKANEKMTTEAESSDGLRLITDLESSDGLRSITDLESSDGLRSITDLESSDGLRSIADLESSDGLRSIADLESSDGLRSITDLESSDNLDSIMLIMGSDASGSKIAGLNEQCMGEGRSCKGLDACGRLTIRVTDTGIGLSEQQILKLFKPFEQADSVTFKKYGGTGLGLAISKRLVEMMGGEIGVSSVEGEGSTFYFTINVRRAKAYADEMVEREKTPSNYRGIFEGYTMLMAEDIDINREIVMSILEETGIKIECAEDGEQAVSMFRADAERYDIIAMDIQMPKLDGLSASKAIRALDAPNAKTIPIIAMTSNAFAEDVIECKAAGASDHIAKPINFELLIKKLKHHLL